VWSITRNSLTGCVVFVGEVGSVLWARHENTPKGTTDSPLFQSRDVHMARQCVLEESFGEIRMIDMVLEDLPNEDREIIMTVCARD
jgi:hypothetical protein